MNAEKYAQIMVIIGNVENAKQIHLSDDERKTLALELVRLNEPLETTLRRAEWVKRTMTYAKLPFEVWINAEQLYTKEEARFMADSIIRQRRERWQDTRKKWNYDELAAEGLSDLSAQGEYYRLRDDEKWVVIAELKKIIEERNQPKGTP